MRSLPCLGAPVGPVGPIPIFETLLSPKNHWSSSRANVVELNAVVYPSSHLSAAVLPTDNSLITRSNPNPLPSPRWGPELLPDLLLGHPILQIAPATAKDWIAEPPEQESKQKTEDHSRNESSFELPYTHRMTSGTWNMIRDKEGQWKNPGDVVSAMNAMKGCEVL